MTRCMYRVLKIIARVSIHRIVVHRIVFALDRFRARLSRARANLSPHTIMRVSVVVDAADVVVTVEMCDDATLADLKAAVACEMDGDPTVALEGVVVKDGQFLRDDESLRANGVAHDDVLRVVREETMRASSHTAAATASSSSRALDADGRAIDPIAMMRSLRADARVSTRLRADDPEFAAIIDREDVEGFQRRMLEMRAREEAMRARQMEELALMNADPFDVEAQRKIEERIRRENVEHNLTLAMDETPEVFAQVVMLYVDVEVNGIALKAFVDSGAQMSIMSVGCARRCGLERLIDDRFVGEAKGVGTQKIVGRIHQAPLKVGTQFMPVMITVLEKEQDIDFIFGLDMLRRHQCRIDLPKNALVIGSVGVELPFLSESEIGKTPFGGAASAETSVETPSSAPAPAASAPDEGKIERLMSLGFSRKRVVEALEATGGNEEFAGSLLFG